MIVDAHGRAALAAQEDAAAIAFLLRSGIREETRTNALRMPPSVLRFLAELDALAHEHAASCQARARSRDSTTEQAQAPRHAQQPS